MSFPFIKDTGFLFPTKVFPLGLRSVYNKSTDSLSIRNIKTSANVQTLLQILILAIAAGKKAEL
jgi:hypothetical protein